MTEVMPMTSSEKLTMVHETLRQTPDEEGIYDLPDHPKMDYDDIFGEPVAYKEEGLGKFIHKGIRKVFGGAFNYTQSTLYYILVMITGLFLGFIWGLIFGALIFVINWIFHPIYKFLYIFMRLAAAIIRPPIRLVLDPIFQGIGQCFSGIRGTVSVQMRGLSVDVSKTQMHQVTDTLVDVETPRYISKQDKVSPNSTKASQPEHHNNHQPGYIASW